MNDPHDVREDSPPPASTVLDRGRRWLSRHERTALAGGVAVQVGLLIAMIGMGLMPLWTGRTVRLRADGYVAHDVLSGESLRLTYDVGQISPEDIEGANLHPDTSKWQAEDYARWRQQLGRTVYVALVPDDDGRHMRAGRTSLEKPDDGLYLRGRIANWSTIEFGIETYSLPKGDVKRFQQARYNMPLTAEIAVAPDGQARLRRIVLDAPGR